MVKAYIRAVIPGYDGEPRISLNTGQFIVTGNDALLQYGFIPLGKGEYLTTGNAMSLLAGRLLTLGKGEFVLTGKDSTLTYTGGSNDAEVDTYITGLATPLSAWQITKLKTFVSALKTGLSITNLSDAFDVMYILGCETAESSLRNLVKNAHHATAVNILTFDPNTYIKGNGTDSYINTNYIPSIHGVKFTVNDASFGILVNNNVDNVNQYDIAGTGSTSTHRILLDTRYTGQYNGAFLNSGGGVNGKFITTSIGLTTMNRLTGVNEVRIFKNGVECAYSDINPPSAAGAGVGVPDVAIPIGAFNDNGTIKNHSLRQYRFAYFGRGLSESENLILYNAVSNLFFRGDFIGLMNNTAESLGMVDTVIMRASGWPTIGQVSTAYDLIQLGLAANSNSFTKTAMGRLTYTFNVLGPNAREITATKDTSTALYDYYTVDAAKSGLIIGLGQDTSNLLGIISDDDGNTFIAIILDADTDRFAAMKSLIDIGILYLNPEHSGSEDVAATAAAVYLPDGTELWSKNPTTLGYPASIVKVLTSIVCSSLVPDMNMMLTINTADITGGTGSTYYDGDQMTYYDAITAMLVESSNTIAEAISRDAAKFMTA